MDKSKTQTTQIAKKISNDRLRELLDTYKPHMSRLLPKHLTAERMLQVTLLGIQRTPRLLECTPASLIGALLQCAHLGLEPDGLTGQAYLVPYWNKNISRYVCEIIPGYKGLMSIARRTRLVTRFQAFPVYEGDEFDYQYGFHQNLAFKPVATNRTDNNLTHAFAMAYEEGEPKFYVSDRTEIDDARSHSKSKNDGPWADHFPAMAIKTSVRRFCKFLPSGADGALATAVALDELHETDLPQGVELLAPELRDADDVETHEAERRDQPRAGGPYPSDVFRAGKEKGWTNAQVQEFVDGRIQRQVSDLVKGDECARMIEAIASSAP